MKKPKAKLDPWQGTKVLLTGGTHKGMVGVVKRTTTKVCFVCNGDGKEYRCARKYIMRTRNDHSAPLHSRPGTKVLVTGGSYQGMVGIVKRNTANVCFVADQDGKVCRCAHKYITCTTKATCEMRKALQPQSRVQQEPRMSTRALFHSTCVNTIHWALHIGLSHPALDTVVDKLILEYGLADQQRPPIQEVHPSQEQRLLSRSVSLAIQWALQFDLPPEYITRTLRSMLNYHCMHLLVHN